MMATGDQAVADPRDPTFGEIDEAALRATLGEQATRLLLATSYIAALQKTVDALRAQVATLRNGHED
jgi:hypothetical protein